MSDSLKDADVYTIEENVVCSSVNSSDCEEYPPVFTVQCGDVGPSVPKMMQCASAKSKEFIGNDDKVHTFEYSKEDYRYHSYMTREEYLIKNDSKQLEYCQKCCFWKLCKNKEFALLTMEGVTDKLGDELAQEINKHLVERLKENFRK